MDITNLVIPKRWFRGWLWTEHVFCLIYLVLPQQFSVQFLNIEAIHTYSWPLPQRRRADKAWPSFSIGKAEPKVQSSCPLSRSRCSEVQLFTLCSLGRTAQWEQKLQSQCAWVCILDPSFYYWYDFGACALTSPRLFSCLWNTNDNNVDLTGLWWGSVS